MKQTIIIFIIAAMASCKGNPNYNPAMPTGPGSKHECIDRTHKKCDGHCTCDGMNCDYALNALVNPRAYQFDIVDDSISVYDGQRLVGTIFFTDDSEIGALIYKDNE